MAEVRAGGDLVQTTEELSHRQQGAAIEHVGHARLLAGPGTGKTRTMINRIVYLDGVRGVLPTQILALAFTRAAAEEIRRRLRDTFSEDAVLPRVATLHSFAMRQLVRNAERYTTLPQPIRVADDWEERWLIQEDLKDALGLNVRDIQQLLRDLSSDWETLRADQLGWETRFPNPEFIAQWRRHRDLYGYTLRSELVYQLKRALEQHGDFQLDGVPDHLLVDEYQDLNPCDLWIVDWFKSNGAEVFAAGDDDQSIYGFRNAYPTGIRRFVADTPGAGDLRLEVCRRCDTAILDLADFIIRTDPRRVAKRTIPEDGRPPGDVRLARFRNEREEAAAIAERCARLVHAEGLPPNEILILLRQDTNRSMSNVLVAALEAQELPVHIDVGGGGPTDTDDGRNLLALLRLVADERDSLAWRSLIRNEPNGLGQAAVSVLHDAAAAARVRVSAVIAANLDGDELGVRWSGRVRAYVSTVVTELAAHRERFDTGEVPPPDRPAALLDAILAIEPGPRVRNVGDFRVAQEWLAREAEALGAEDLRSLLQALGATRERRWKRCVTLTPSTSSACTKPRVSAQTLCSSRQPRTSTFPGAPNRRMRWTMLDDSFT